MKTYSKWPRRWLLIIVFSLVLVPVAVFLGGLFLAGPYEGEAGYFGLAGGIYADAVTGHTSALILLLAPLLLLWIWQLAALLSRVIRQRQQYSQKRATAPAP